jgi:hypothetical protein
MLREHVAAIKQIATLCAGVGRLEKTPLFWRLIATGLRLDVQGEEIKGQSVYHSNSQLRAIASRLRMVTADPTTKNV